MSSLHASVADFYRYVVGVDTHAATHSYAIIAAPNGALVDQASFPTTPAGLRRARDWIGRRTDGDLDGVLISAEGTGSYGAVLGDVLADAGYRVVEAPTPRRDRGRGKTDALDAVLAARSTLVMELAELRDRRAGEAHTALQVLTGARDQLNADRLRCINALTALVRGHDLGLDARRALTSHQIATVASWRRREESLGVATARAEAVRLAKRILILDDELAVNRADLTALAEAQAPELLDLTGVGAITAAIVLTVWSYPGRIRSEAAFAQIAGTCPIPASSGNTVRHRLNRGGDRRLNRALNTIVLTRMRTDPTTRIYIERRLAEGKTSKEIRRCLKRYIGLAGSGDAEGRMAACQMSFPVVLKPSGGFGTMSTTRIESPRDLEEILASYRPSPLIRSRHLIVEEYIPGRELCVDAVWRDGEEVTFVVHSYLQPSIEVGTPAHGVPPTLDGSYILAEERHVDLYARYRDVQSRVNRALDIRDGATHMEVFEPDEGPLVFGEIANRVGGLWIGMMLSEYLGCNVWDLLARGQVMDDWIPTRPSSGAVAAVNIRPARPGRVRCLPTDEEIARVPGVRSWHRAVEPGHRAHLDSASEAYLLLLIVADDEEACREACLTAADLLSVEVAPD